MDHYKYYDAVELLGKIITEIKINESQAEVYITTSDGIYEMYHSQDCCETVRIENVFGDPTKLIGDVLVVAHEDVLSNEYPDDVPTEERNSTDSFTYTIYTFATKTAEVKIRWLGTSNGYYSESVQITKISQ